MDKLAVQDKEVTDKELISYLDTLGLTSKLTDPEKVAFLSIAKSFNLNPFKREIHASKYGDNFSVVTGYEVYLKRAERTGLLDGWEVTSTGNVESGDLKAILTIYRKDREHPFVWEALYSECVQKTKEGNVTKFWQKAVFMTKKVAISQGFRLCFSDELAGMPYTADEYHPEETTEDISHEEIKDGKTVIINNGVPTLSPKQFEKLLKSKKEVVGQYLDAIEQEKLIATPEQHKAIKSKYNELDKLEKTEQTT